MRKALPHCSRTFAYYKKDIKRKQFGQAVFTACTMHILSVQADAECKKLGHEKLRIPLPTQEPRLGGPLSSELTDLCPFRSGQVSRTAEGHHLQPRTRPPCASFHIQYKYHTSIDYRISIDHTMLDIQAGVTSQLRAALPSLQSSGTCCPVQRSSLHSS